MNIVTLTPHLAASWDEVARASDEAWIFHLSGWLSLTEKAWGFAAKSFAVQDQGEMIGIFPLQMHHEKKVLKSTFMGPAGPAIKNGVEAGIRQKALKMMMAHVEQIAAECGSPMVEIAISPLTEASLNSRWQVNPLVHHGYQDISTHSWLIDLSSSEEELYKKVSRITKRKVKEALTAGYRLRPIRSRREIDIYYDIHCQTYRRTGAAPHPKAYFEGIYDEFTTQHKTQSWFVENKQGELVAAANIALFKEKALYWTACCRDQDFPKGVYYLLLWQAIISAKRRGAKWFDCAEAFPEAREGKLKGLSEFKRKFGGTLHRYYKGRLILKPPLQESAFRQWLRSTRKLLESWLGEKMVGDAVYLLRRLYHGVDRWQRLSFLKPYWHREEFFCGLLYRDRAQEKAAVKVFVRRFRRKLKIKGAALVATSSGRTALELGLKVLKQRFPGKTKVILPAYGCKGTLDPILKVGLIPVFADIDTNLNISQEMVKEYLRQPEDILAVLVPHIGGCHARIEEIACCAQQKGVFVIEDVCQALGGKDQKGFWGTRYDMAIFSFGMGKNLMATAGGMLVSRVLIKEVHNEAKNLGEEETAFVKQRFWHIIFKYFLHFSRDIHPYLAGSYQYQNMHPLDAKLMCLQLSKMKSILQRRRANARALLKAFGPTHKNIAFTEQHHHVHTKFSVICADQITFRSLIRHLHKEKIEIEEMYVPLHLRDEGRAFLKDKSLAFTEHVYKTVFNMPIRPNLTPRQMNHIVETIKSYAV